MMPLQDGAADKDQIFPNWKAAVGRAQLGGKVREGELQAAAQVPAGRGGGTRAAVRAHSVHAGV